MTADAAYVGGGYDSPDFPTVHPLRPVYSGNGDAFVAKLTSEGEDPLVTAFVSFNPLEATFQTIPETQRCPAGFVSTFSFTARLSDTSASTSLADLQVEVAAITNRNLLQNTDGDNTPETTFEPAAPFVLTVEDGLLSLRAQEASLRAIVEALGRQLDIEVVARISPEEHVGRWHLRACLTVVSRTRAAVKNLAAQGRLPCRLICPGDGGESVTGCAPGESLCRQGFAHYAQYGTDGAQPWRGHGDDMVVKHLGSRGAHFGFLMANPCDYSAQVGPLAAGAAGGGGRDPGLQQCGPMFVGMAPGYFSNTPFFPCGPLELEE